LFTRTCNMFTKLGSALDLFILIMFFYQMDLGRRLTIKVFLRFQ
jgi:hypothetical protein